MNCIHCGTNKHLHGAGVLKICSKCHKKHSIGLFKEEEMF